MARKKDYIEVDAVIRMPKGKRLADSKKTKGWSRGYTPKSTDGGPEHVEIRIKEDGEGAASEKTFTDPSPPTSKGYFQPPREDYFEQPRPKTPEQEKLEELLQLLVRAAIVKATRWAEPRLERLWYERMVPFFNAKWDQWQEHRALRKADKQGASEAPPNVAQATSVEETNGVSDGLKAHLTSAEARQHFAEALIAQHFANEKMRLLAAARIKDGGLPDELADAVLALTPKQVENALNSILASKPTLFDDLGKTLHATPGNKLQLERDKVKAVRRLIND